MGCGKHNDGTIVAAHSNLLEHGKGKGLKAHDCYAAALCFDCHSDLDQGKDLTYEERRDFWIKAFHNTILWLWTEGRIKLK